MRIAVMGSGGLGGYFGARLCRGGADVHFIARGKHLQAMRIEGLRIEGPEPIHVARVNATDDPVRSRHRRFRHALRQTVGHRSSATADPPDGRPRHDNHFVSERCPEGSVPASRLRRLADHGWCWLRRNDDRQTGRHTPNGADAETTVRRVRRLPIASSASASRRLSRGRHQGGTLREHPSRDLAEVCVPGGSVGDHNDNSQAYWSDPRESTDSRFSCST